MNISDQLLQPLLERIESEYKDLLGEIADNHEEEILELKNFIHKKLRQLQMVKVSLFYIKQGDSHVEEAQANLRDTLRQCKLELRYARRRLKRQLTTMDRFTKVEKMAVPTVAA